MSDELPWWSDRWKRIRMVCCRPHKGPSDFTYYPDPCSYDAGQNDLLEEPGFFVPYDQARALYEGARMVLEWQKLEDAWMLDDNMERPDVPDEAIALLRKGIGEE